MRKLLEKAFEEASKLPEEEQDALARAVLEELASERRWDELFANSPELVNNSKPSVLRSSRPMLTQRPLRMDGRAAKTVGRPFSSFRVHTSPAGL